MAKRDKGGTSGGGGGKPAKAKAKKKGKDGAKARKPDAKGSKDKKKKKKGKKDKRKEKKKKKKSMAERADRHALYQESVQSPEADVEFFDKVFRHLRKRRPKTLREDFCGTAYLSRTWVESDPKRRAIGIDLDGQTLAWAQEHNVAALDASARQRVQLHEADVLDGVGDRADITCAMNFSYGVFMTRAELRRYFEVVFDRLADDGVFFTELYGGLEAVVELEEERECDGFTYVWEQVSYNPIDHLTKCHIHFEFPDRSRLERAFTYDWRLWTIPELRELLLEVGFSDVTVYWEATDSDGDGTGEFLPTEREENQEAWLVYIVAAK